MRVKCSECVLSFKFGEKTKKKKKKKEKKNSFRVNSFFSVRKTQLLRVMKIDIDKKVKLLLLEKR